MVTQRMKNREQAGMTLAKGKQKQKKTQQFENFYMRTKKKAEQPV